MNPIPRPKPDPGGPGDEVKIEWWMFIPALVLLAILILFWMLGVFG
jgi:hypothetical protein